MIETLEASPVALRGDTRALRGDTDTKTRNRTATEFLTAPPMADVCGIRAQGIWRAVINSPRKLVPLAQEGASELTTLFVTGVMLNVQFETVADAVGPGCGGYFEGHALGELHLGEELERADTRPIRFDRDLGCFMSDGRMVARASVLILRPQCHAVYVP